MDRNIANTLGIWTAVIVSVIAVIGFLWNIQSSVNSLHSDLADVHADLADMRADIAGVHASIAEVHRDIGDLRERMARVETKLDSHLTLPHGPAQPPPQPQ